MKKILLLALVLLLFLTLLPSFASENYTSPRRIHHRFCLVEGDEFPRGQDLEERLADKDLSEEEINRIKEHWESCPLSPQEHRHGYKHARGEERGPGHCRRR